MPKPGGYAQVPRWLIRAPWSRAYEIAVYAILAEHADDAGYCWPSLARVAALSGTSLSTVQRVLLRLERGGAVAREIQRGEVTRYQVLRRPFTVAVAEPAALDQVAAAVTGGQLGGTRGPNNPGHTDRGLSTTPVTEHPQPRSHRRAITRTNELEGDTLAKYTDEETAERIARVRLISLEAMEAVDMGTAERYAQFTEKKSSPAAAHPPPPQPALEADQVAAGDTLEQDTG